MSSMVSRINLTLLLSLIFFHIFPGAIASFVSPMRLSYKKLVGYSQIDQQHKFSFSPQEVEAYPDQYHEVHWLNDDEIKAGEYDWMDDFEIAHFNSIDESGDSLGDSIGQGKAVVCIPDVANEDECLQLFEHGMAAFLAQGGDATRGRSRFSVSDPTAFPSHDVVMSCDEILLRVIDYIDQHIPSVYERLFRPTFDNGWAKRQPLNAQMEQPSVPPLGYLSETCPSLRDLYLMGELEWSEGEPAINVYQGGGQFGAHKDHLALTVLIPLTEPDQDFSGGGTGFWTGNRRTGENPSKPPTTVLRPSAGSALVFGGDVTHAGMPVEDGYRSVFVCSFSTRTPASPENRLHGMHAPPEVTPGFKGT